MDPVEKYIANYAEPEARQIFAGNSLSQNYHHLVVVPCAAESAGLPRLLASLDAAAAHVAARGKALAIICVNEREGADPAISCDNARCMEFLRSVSVSWENLTDNGVISYATRGGIDLVVIHRAREGFRFGAKDGVGLARKIGADVAVSLWQRRQYLGQWIHTTDGDAQVPFDYFDMMSSPHPAPAAAVLEFVHEPVVIDSPETTGGRPIALVQEAIALYERYLYYYEAGLARAGSPYAFQTVGSSMAFSPSAYAAVRGFPRKNAGEDFYLLNKLAKVGFIWKKGGAPIRLSGRVSLRVPFGTGASVARIATDLAEQRLFSTYDPRSFVTLGILLGVLREFSEHRDIQRAEASLVEAGEQRFGKPVGEEMLALLREAKWEHQVAELLHRCKTAENLQRQLHIWWDAFRTLKWLHGVRDRIFPEVVVPSLPQFPQHLPS